MLPFETFGDLVSRVFVQVAVHIHRDSDAGVPEVLLDVARMRVGCDQQGCAGVAQIVRSQSLLVDFSRSRLSPWTSSARRPPCVAQLDRPAGPQQSSCVDTRANPYEQYDADHH